MTTVSFRMTAGTNVGSVRSNNEDNFIINEDLSQSEWFLPQDTSQIIQLGKDGCIMAIADGMGGLNAGEVASDIAIKTIQRSFLDADLSKMAKSAKSIEKFMCDMVVQADTTMKKHVVKNPQTKGMGTTIIFTWIHQGVAHLTWCGDSRAYIYNPQSGLIRFSKDHSYVQQLVDEGKLDEDLAFDHPDSNIVTRCLGDFADKAQPEFKTHRLQKGDIILLCTDGLCGMCRDEEILEVLQNHSSDLEKCKQELIQHALNAGGYDNVTLSLFETVEIVSDEESEFSTATINDKIENETVSSDIKYLNTQKTHSLHRSKSFVKVILFALLILIVGIICFFLFKN